MQHAHNRVDMFRVRNKLLLVRNLEQAARERRKIDELLNMDNKKATRDEES